MKIRIAGRDPAYVTGLGLVAALLIPNVLAAQTVATALEQFLDARAAVYQAGSTDEDLDAFFALFAEDASYDLMPGASLEVFGAGSDLANLRQTLETNRHRLRSAVYTIEQRTASPQLATGLVRWSFEWEHDGAWESITTSEHLVIETINGRISRVIQHGAELAQR
jgi:ketosteroid isomerase-like protein